MTNILEVAVEEMRRFVHIAVKRRWLALGVATVTAAGSIAAVFIAPERYQASARVYVDTQTVLKPLMASLTFQLDIDQQVSMLARTLISRPNMEKLVALPELKFNIPSEAAREAAVSRLMNEIKVSPTASGNLYEISYRGPSPDRARRLVEATTELFVHAGAGAKKRDSEDAGRFIEEQIRSYETKLVGAEDRLKDFKIRNFGVSGVSAQDYFTRVSTLSDEVAKLRIDLSAAEQSREAFRRELSAEEPQLPIEPTARTGDLETRLQTQQKSLDELLRRYTDAHPDVISTRRQIEQLEGDIRARNARERTQGSRPPAATSPVYQKLRVSLAEAEAIVASLRSQLVAKQAALNQVRSVAGRVPQVEAELVQLNRDYDIIRKNYDLMVARRESANLGLKLDESSQLAEFRVVEPPRVSERPAFPSRLHLAAMALFLSLAAGMIAAAVAESAWPTLDDKRSLQEFSQRPVLGTISILMTPDRLGQTRAGHLRFAAALGTLVLVQSTWLAWLAVRTTST